MAKKPSMKMTIEERAKQFQPFSALKGLEEAILAKEKEQAEKKILSDEMAEVLNKKISLLTKGREVTLTYYSDAEYLTLTGEISLFDPTFRRLRINNQTINFSDILDISFTNES